jgi:hypothetical protein
MMMVTRVKGRNQRRGIDSNQSSFQFSANHSSKCSP